MNKQNKILIRGIGVIGFPVAKLFLTLKNKFHDLEIYLEPYQIDESNLFTILDFCKEGAKIVSTELNDAEKFSELKDFLISQKEVNQITNLVLDCSPSGIAESRMQEYNSENFPSCKKFIAQGSEHKFGTQILFPENTYLVENENQKFFHISTCNTHTLVSIIRNLSDSKILIENIDFVVIRRDADMAKNDPHVTGPLFQIPKFGFGTHHAKYTNEVYQTIDKQFSISSSAMTVNSPYMHVTRFNAKLNSQISKEKILSNLENDKYSSTTNMTSTNMIFSSGRDRGISGRIFSHGVWVLPCLEVHDSTVRGIVATPGDSNVILSTIYAGLKSIQYPNFESAKNFLDLVIIKNV